MDRQAAIVLGKALFWDQQAGSDGMACASCHFHAGADNRVKNTMDPGLRHTDPNKQNIWNPVASGGHGGPNYTLTRADFPFHQLATEDRDSAIVHSTDDIVSSQGVFRADFNGINLTGPANQAEQCSAALSSTFSVGGINVRQVEPRNTPTVINAVFNYRNFWDGRANNIFNGRNPFGPRDPTAGIDPFNSVMVWDGVSLSPLPIALPDSSLASQSVGPPGSNLEMSCNNRVFEQIGQKLLRQNPLALQTIAATDSVLGPYANKITGTSIVKAGMWDPITRSLASYETLIKRAFAPKFWNSPIPTGDNYRQIEKNFSFFWGVSIMLYESTLVSDNTPFDQYANGNISALTAQQTHGFSVFNNNGECVFCHKGAEFTSAATSLKEANAEGTQVEHMAMGDGTAALYDTGFYNLGVTPTAEDIGSGGTDPWGNPLNWARQLKNYIAANGWSSQYNNIGPDHISVNTALFQVLAPFNGLDGNARDAVDGNMKVPDLRNVELTGPFFHNGAYSTLEQVMDFYDRGGNGRTTNPPPDCLPAPPPGVPYTFLTCNDAANTTGFGSNATNRAPSIFPLNLSDADKAALVAFLKSLTDERVRWEKAPFDHPSLNVPNGHMFNEYQVLANGTTGYAMDYILALPAVGAAGRTAAMGPLLSFDAGLK
ncbi:MAG: cytochrome-c peroxidase [Acidobacteriia bacterium]|nr:cytochrome-c peroxidase [Terriglobia bacterium]